MSVINKMLRDLDARRVMLPGMPAETALKMGAPRWGHAPVLPQLEQPKRWYWFAGFALLAMAAGAGYLSSRFHAPDDEAIRKPHSTVIVTSDPAFVSNPVPMTEQSVNLPASAVAPIVIAATVTSPTTAVTQTVVTAPVASPSAPAVSPPKVLAPQGALKTPGSAATVTTAATTALPAPAVVPALNKPAVMPVPTATVQAAVQTPAPMPATPKVIQAAPVPAQRLQVVQAPAASPVAQKPLPVPTQAVIAPAAQVPVVTPNVNKPAPVAVPSVPAQSTQAKMIPVQTAPTPVVAVKTVSTVPPVATQAPVSAAKVQSPPTVAAPVQTNAVPAPQVNPPKPAAVIAPVTAAPKPASNPPAPVAQPNRQAATQEALAQAQGLWNTGSRDAAVDLMREAVAVTESAYNAGKLAADSPVLVSLVRELTRMELTEGRPLRVLELLIRLEPAITKQADLWAVRGNAAQRLSRHQESVMSYAKALGIRPEEPRWMLASAVSLAALGRLEESAVLADKANAAGVVSSEILAYLKQIGVPVKPI